MTQVQARASALIAAPAEQVYAILADYRDGHPHILPKQYFTSLEVEEGGIGAGTVVRFDMTAMGRTRTFRSTITEPEPGRVLVETDPVSGTETTFSIQPNQQGTRSYVTISTVVSSRSGVLGLPERFLTKWFLQRVYKQELGLLSAVVAERTRS